MTDFFCLIALNWIQRHKSNNSVESSDATSLGEHKNEYDGHASFRSGLENTVGERATLLS